MFANARKRKQTRANADKRRFQALWEGAQTQTNASKRTQTRANAKSKNYTPFCVPLLWQPQKWRENGFFPGLELFSLWGQLSCWIVYHPDCPVQTQTPFRPLARNGKKWPKCGFWPLASPEKKGGKWPKNSKMGLKMGFFPLSPFPAGGLKWGLYRASSSFFACVRRLFHPLGSQISDDDLSSSTPGATVSDAVVERPAQLRSQRLSLLEKDNRATGTGAKAPDPLCCQKVWRRITLKEIPGELEGKSRGT